MKTNKQTNPKLSILQLKQYRQHLITNPLLKFWIIQGFIQIVSTLSEQSGKEHFKERSALSASLTALASALIAELPVKWVLGTLTPCALLSGITSRSFSLGGVVCYSHQEDPACINFIYGIK